MDTGFSYSTFGESKKFSNCYYLFSSGDSDADEKPYLILHFNKTYISIYRGLQLTKGEKKLKWYYQNYDTVKDLVQDITVFLVRYKKSFHLVRKTK